MGREAGMEGAQVYGEETLDHIRLRVGEYPLSDVMLATGLLARTLKDLKNGTTKQPTNETLAAIATGLWLLESANTFGISGWRDIPNSTLAVDTGLSVEQIWEVRGGKRRLSQDEWVKFIANIQTWRKSLEDCDNEENTSETAARAFVTKLLSQGEVAS